MTVHDMSHTETIDIAAAPQAVYDTVRQLERMGEWSPENTGGEWLEGDGSSVGDVFEGVNKIGDREWSVACVVNKAESGSTFGFYTGPAENPYVQWTYTVKASGDGATLSEHWDVLTLPPTLAEAPPEQLAGRTKMVQEGMKTTLANLKKTLES